jgi:hypothetical protein
VDEFAIGSIADAKQRFEQGWSQSLGGDALKRGRREI